jgi:hypothetical protein
MATNTKTFNSLGGFSVGNKTIVSDTFDVSNINSLEIKNSYFSSDANKTDYILKGSGTTILTVDNSGNYINIPSNTISFVTGTIVAVNNTGSGYYSLKVDTILSCNVSGVVNVINNFTTILKDSVDPSETWIIAPNAPANQKFSYATTVSGSSIPVKWICYLQVVNVSWL